MKRSTNINQILALFIALFVVTAFSACSDISGTDYSNDIFSESFSQEFDKRDSRNNGNGADQPDPNSSDALDENGKIYVCKFVTTPDKGTEEEASNEVLKKGNKGLVHVDPNSIRNEIRNMTNGEIDWPIVNVGDWWQDKHYKSVVIPPYLGENIMNNTYLGKQKIWTAEEIEKNCIFFFSLDGAF